ncbi:MAG: alpha/beta fold hydrolase [Burkholderiales bacterium]|nr:MAG: alpha/beta fold hydrolase [Burkholderiales bacterium]
MPSIYANGVRLEYESIGDPQAPAIVLIMGLGMQSIAWPDEFCAGLAREGFRVIRFDNRDSGLSSRMSGGGTAQLMLALAARWLRMPVRVPYTLDDMADDTAALMDALGIGRAHVVGASMGGMIAQLVAIRHPARVASLTSIMSGSGNPAVLKPTPGARNALMRPAPNPADVDAVVEHMVSLFGVIGSPGFPVDHAELRGRIERGVRRAYDPAGTTRQLLAIIAARDRRPQLHRIAAPTLVIHGVQDPLVPIEAGRETARSIPGARLMAIDGMGHDLPRTLWPALVEAIAGHCRAAAC